MAMATTGFSLQEGTSSCSGGFTLDSLDFICDDDGACTMGETMGMQGSISASSDLPSTAVVDLQGCVFSYICYTYSLTSVDLCSNLQSSDGSTSCPSAGSYTFDSSFNSLGDGSWEIPSWLAGYTVTVTATITDSESSATETTCSLKVSTTSSSSSSSTSYFMVGSVAVFAMFGSVFWMRRRKTRTSAANMHLLEFENTAEQDEIEFAARGSRLTAII
eukprot:CAMPEP_0119003434 /NCGR_PEP_ID=MMETSP1176-20130426/558_1 /TAXON_ID=265551 /ORGANISM="Synedropsis recta cf, Strain CCMP1620" /LENGTH=217 /DNA_ID=CAMNT_0006955035 /DNA_START=102 /DNA_END=755 /DNA_ORIENTATION=+